MANVINNSKACLFNLIVFCQAEQCSIFLRTYINQLSQKFPFRLINIELSTDSKIKDIDVKQGSNAEDQIFITTPKKHLKDVPLLILPYLIPDLPIYLLWGEDPTEENNIFPEALKYSSRVFFDSSTPDDLQKFARKLTNLHKDSQIGLIDLNIGLDAIICAI